MLDAIGEHEVSTGARRCHLWWWGPATSPVEWEERRLVVGGLSPLGLLAAGVTAGFSAAGNRRRRDDAIRDAAPRWRYAASGVGWVRGTQFVLREDSGLVRSFDLGAVPQVDSPSPGWLRLAGDPTRPPWAIKVT